MRQGHRVEHPHRVRAPNAASGGAVLAAVFAVFAVLGVLAAFATPTASAQESADRDKARAKAEESARHYELGNYDLALEGLREAQALFPSPALQFNFGLVYRALLRDLEALEAFDSFLANAESPDQAKKAEAQKHVQELRGRVVTLDLVCDTDGAELLVDGRSYGRTPLPRGVRLAPGPHQVVVQKEDRQPFVDRFEAAGGERIRVHARLSPPAAAAPAPPSAALASAPAPPTPAPPPRRIYARWWFWTAAAGVVAAAAGGVWLASGGTKGPCDDCVATFRVRP